MASKTKTERRNPGPALRGMPINQTKITAVKSQTQPQAATKASAKTAVKAQGKTGGTQKKPTSDFEIAMRKEVGRRIKAMMTHLQTGQSHTAAAKSQAKDSQAVESAAVLPVSNFRVSSRFGEDRGNHRHSGIDLALPTGSEVRVCESGTVTYADWSNGYGYRIVVDHGNGRSTTYNHLSDIGVEVGQKVAKGTQIARSGNTGNSTGPHLHFEVKINGEYVNPEEYYDFGSGKAVKGSGNYTSKLSAAQKQRGSGSGKSDSKGNAKVNSAVNKVSFKGVPKVTADALAVAQVMQRSDVFPLNQGRRYVTAAGRNNPLFDVVPYYKNRIR